MSTGRYRTTLSSVAVTAAASVELLFRSLADVVPVLPDLVAAGVAIALPFVSERTLQAWVIGWLFLGLLAYQVCLRMDAIRIRGDGQVPFRRSLALGAAGLAVGFGVTVKQQVFALVFGHGSVPSPIAQNVFVVLAGCCLFYLVCTLPVVAGERLQGGSATLGTALGLLAYETPRTLFLGPSLAIAATLYPLPEVAVVTWLVAIVGVNTVPFGPQIRGVLNDPVERLVVGAAAARRGIEGYVTLFYVFGGMTYSLATVIGSEGTTRSILLELLRSVGRDPGSALFLVISVFGPAVYGFWYWLRLAERLPFEFGVLDPGTGTGSSWGSDGSESIGSVEFRSLPAGFGVPVSLLLLPVGLYVGAVGSDPLPRPIPLGYVAFACFVAGLALLSVLRTRERDPRERLPVRIVAPVALSLQIALFVVMGADPVARIGHGLLTANAVGPVGPGLLSAVGESALFAGLTLVPAAIPRLIRSESTLLSLAGLYAATVLAAILLNLLGGLSEGAGAIGALLILGAPLVWGGIAYVADALEPPGESAKTWDF